MLLLEFTLWKVFDRKARCCNVCCLHLFVNPHLCSGSLLKCSCSCLAFGVAGWCGWCVLWIICGLYISLGALVLVQGCLCAYVWTFDPEVSMSQSCPTRSLSPCWCPHTDPYHTSNHVTYTRRHGHVTNHTINADANQELQLLPRTCRQQYGTAICLL